MKIKIVTYEKGNELDILREYETNNPEIFTEGRKISFDNCDLYIVKRSWLNVSSETLYVQVAKMGSIFNVVKGFI